MNIIDNDPKKQLTILANSPFSQVNKESGNFEEINLFQFIGQKIQSFFDIFRKNKHDYTNSKLKEYKLIQLLQANAHSFREDDLALIKKAAIRCGLVDSNIVPSKHLELYKTIRKIQDKFNSTHLSQDSNRVHGDEAADYFHHHISDLMGYSSSVLKVVKVANSTLSSPTSSEPSSNHPSTPPATPLSGNENPSNPPSGDTSNPTSSTDQQTVQDETNTPVSSSTPPASPPVSGNENPSNPPSGDTSNPTSSTDQQTVQDETNAPVSSSTPPASPPVSENDDSSNPPSGDTSLPANSTEHRDAQGGTDTRPSTPTPPASSRIVDEEPVANDSSANQGGRRYTHITNEDLNEGAADAGASTSVASSSTGLVSQANDGHVENEALNQLQSRIQELKENKDRIDPKDLVDFSRDVKIEVKKIKKLPETVSVEAWTLLLLQASALSLWAKQNDRLKYLQGVLQLISPDDSCDLSSYKKLKAHVEASAQQLEQLNSILINPTVHFPSNDVLDLDTEEAEIIGDLEFDLSFVPMDRTNVAKYLEEKLTQKYDQMLRESEVIQTDLIRAFGYSKFKTQCILIRNENAVSEKLNYIERLKLFKNEWNEEKLVRRVVCIEHLSDRIDEIKDLYERLYSIKADTKPQSLVQALRSKDLTDEQINRLCSFDDNKWLEMFHEVARGFTTWDAAFGPALDPLSSSIPTAGGAQDRYLNTSSKFLAAVTTATGSRFTPENIDLLRELLIGGAKALQEIYDPSTNMDRLVEIWNGNTTKQRESLFIAISWVLTYMAQQKNQMFKEGAYIIDDPEDRLFNFISQLTGVYNRPSSHLNPMTPAWHRGFDIASEWKLMPEHKGHILFTPMIDKDIHRIYLKPETFGMWRFTDFAGHAYEYGESLARRYGATNEGANEAEGYRKERVPESVLADFRGLVKDFPEAASYEQEAKVQGIRAMLRIIENKIREASSPEWNVRANEFLNNIRTKYDHAEKRIGQEVIISTEEMTKALYNIINNL